ncbi:MAG: hypothetical protein ACYCZN_16060 [Candidatus Dormibacteria bacterium]
MRRWLPAHSPIWSSQLLGTGAARAGTRLGIGPEVVEAALDTCSLVLPSVRTFFEAVRLPPPGLPALDAVHLATAIEIGDDLEGAVGSADLPDPLSLPVAISRPHLSLQPIAQSQAQAVGQRETLTPDPSPRRPLGID